MHQRADSHALRFSPPALLVSVLVALVCHTLMIALDLWQFLPEYAGIIGWVMSALAGVTYLKKRSEPGAGVQLLVVFVGLLALLVVYSMQFSWHVLGERF
jgi:hypothetical protein